MRAKGFKTIKNLVYSAVFAAAFFTFGGGTALAQALPKSCDSDVYDVIKASAETSVQREIEAAQSIILKPDSVLQYSCFRKQARKVVDSSPYKLASGYQAVAGQPVQTYLSRNFDYKLDGDSIDPPNDNPSEPCTIMDQVWTTARCLDFDKDLFRSFSELAGSDPRTFPESCSGDRSALAAGAQASNPKAGQKGGADVAVSFVSDLTQCGSAIKTGIQVRFANGSTSEDAACLAPQCRNNGKGSCIQ